MDIYSSRKRSIIMSKISGKNTKPEMIVRKYLHSLGYRYSLHRKDLPGKPDLVLSKYNTVIFINGCFWHSHKNCKASALPTSNKKFWEKKISDNILRDKKYIRELRSKGWKVIIVWQCQLKNQIVQQKTIKRIIKGIKKNGRS